MRQFSTGSIGVDQGAEVLFEDFQHDGVMWTGTGPRSARCPVRFARPFSDVPTVTVGLSMWDIDHRTNARVDVTAEDVTTEGFVILFRTWGDTRVARVRAEWIAIGALPHPDNWDVL